MNKKFYNRLRRVPLAVALVVVGWLSRQGALANPTGGVVTQGAASFGSAGSTFSINQSSSFARISWQSFNINQGQTTVFNQPSASSVTWNYISDPNASIINGGITANGYVVLQNPNGFTVGGDASITAHGLVMTTASPTIDFSGGGAWSFDAPPPTAKIINYGQINITGGGAAYLIAGDIVNNGTISAPGGQIGLFAGQKVLLSFAPDGRGLSAEVTLPQGSVDNNGQLIADAGSIAAKAQFVNQNGLVQANSVREVNGTIELVASDRLNLGDKSVISAQGDSQGTSAGGSVVVKSDNQFSDQTGSTINIAGGAPGGAGGHAEISARQLGALQTAINGRAAAGATGGTLLIDPYDLTIDSSYASSLATQIAGGLSQIDLQADHDIILSASLNLADASTSSMLTLIAGNNITFNSGSAIKAGTDWNVNLTAGASLASGATPTAGNDGIYLNGTALILSKNGDINLHAANEVLVSGGAIRTISGGNINVTADYGDVNSGYNYYGFTFGQSAAPYYKVNLANLGGISTGAGGNVSISAGGDVISYLPVQSDYAHAIYDGGTGAFGSPPGNVTIQAGGNVYGHYVLANGVGNITAGGDLGAATATLINDPEKAYQGFALSLISGSWDVSAGGNVYVQDVRNPNGIFGERNASSTPINYAGYHAFDYAADASVSLAAAGSVEITGYDAPHKPLSNPDIAIPLILPPSLKVTTDAGDLILDSSVILYPSADQNLNLTLAGSLIGVPNGDPINLAMSDSAATRWTQQGDFETGDHAVAPLGSGNQGGVNIKVGGNWENLNIYTTKKTDITAGGDVINSGFAGENLTAGDTTSIYVNGNIYNSPLLTFAQLPSAIVSANPLQPAAWDSVFELALDPALVAQLTSFDATHPPGGDLAAYLKAQNYLLFPSASASAYGSNPGFIYDASSLQLAFRGNMLSSPFLSANKIAALESGTFTVLVADSQGNPVIDPATGHLQVRTYDFSAAPVIASMVAASQSATTTEGLGFLIGGPGAFAIHARSIDLGYSPGIISYGFGSRYASLQSLTGRAGEGGASVDVSVNNNLSLLTSSINSIDGGKVTVHAGGNIDLGSGGFDFQNNDCYGIFTSGYSDVEVTAAGDINVGGGCIATFNGGDVTVESVNGHVNAGNGVNRALQVYTIYPNPTTGLPLFGTMGDLTDLVSLQVDPAPYGSGILAEFPTKKYQWAYGFTQPGNITIKTPHGNIVSSRGGISQFALNSSIGGEPSVTLEAGLAGVAATADSGNVILGMGGVIGGTVNVTARGKVEGLIVSQHDANISAAQSFSGTVLSGGTANFAGSGSIAGTVVGIAGISTGAGNSSGANLLSQNVSSGNGSSQSTLGTSATATTASQAAAQQSSQAANQQASTDTSSDDDLKKKKKPRVRKVSRVTVLLSSAENAH